MEDAIGQAVGSLFPSGAPVKPSQKQKFHLFCLPVERFPVLFVLLVRPTPCALHPRGSDHQHHHYLREVPVHLPNHLVGLVALAQAEGRGQVAGEVLLLLDVGQEGLVDRLLVCCAAGGDLGLLYTHLRQLSSSAHMLRTTAVLFSSAISKAAAPALAASGCGMVSYLWLLSLLEESLLAGLLLLGLLANKVLGLGDLVDLLGVDTGQVNLLGGGDDVSGVDSSQGHTVDLEGTGDEQNTLVEGLEENDTLATEAASQQDQDGAGLQGGAGLPGADGLANLFVKTLSVPAR